MNRVLLLLLTVYMTVANGGEIYSFKEISLSFNGRHELSHFTYNISSNEDNKSCTISLIGYDGDTILREADELICHLFNSYLFYEYEIQRKIKKQNYRLPGEYDDPIRMEVKYTYNKKEFTKKIIVPNKGIKIYKGSISHMAHKFKTILNKKYLSF